MNDNRDGRWKRLWRQPRTRWLLGIPAGGFIMLLVGAAGLGAVTEVFHLTSTNEFCFSCRSHETNIRAEYEASKHFSNASGVRAGCADCHLPHDSWLELAVTKMRVSVDIIPEFMGKLDTPEKYEANRKEMANIVWKQFKDNDSKFCRSCHSFDAMAASLQSSMGRNMHDTAVSSGRTCIDCHKGVTHKLPAAS